MTGHTLPSSGYSWAACLRCSGSLACPLLSLCTWHMSRGWNPAGEKTSIPPRPDPGALPISPRGPVYRCSCCCDPGLILVSLRMCLYISFTHQLLRRWGCEVTPGMESLRFLSLLGTSSSSRSERKVEFGHVASFFCCNTFLGSLWAGNRGVPFPGQRTECTYLPGHSQAYGQYVCTYGGTLKQGIQTLPGRLRGSSM